MGFVSQDRLTPPWPRLLSISIVIALLFAATTVEVVLETYEKEGLRLHEYCANLDTKLKCDYKSQLLSNEMLSSKFGSF